MRSSMFRTSLLHCFAQYSSDVKRVSEACLDKTTYLRTCVFCVYLSLNTCVCVLPYSTNDLHS